jgi:hypothetical protein
MDYLLRKNGREINQEIKINDSFCAVPFLSLFVLRYSVCSFSIGHQGINLRTKEPVELL